MRARGGGGGRGWPGAGRGVRQPGLGLRGLLCGARARAGAGPAGGGAGAPRTPRGHVPPPRGRPADCKARPRGEGGFEEIGASAFLEGRLPPRRPRGGQAGGARGTPAPRAAALEAGGESRVTAGSRGRRWGGGSNKESRAKVASPGAYASQRTSCKAARVRSAPRFGP